MRLYFAHLLLFVVGSLGAWSADAATYYVRNGGNDSADGKSHATAWASLSKVNGFSFAAGDHVLFHEGDRWVGMLTVDWAGTTTARAVVGSYYLDGSTPVRGYRTARPIIDGESRYPDSTPYAPLVLVKTDRVTVENLQIQNSIGQGLSVGGGAEVEVLGCKVSNVYTAGIHFKKTTSGRAENNIVTVAGIGARDKGLYWGASIEAVGAKSTIIRGNTVSEVWGEGINANSGSQYTLIERNRVFAARAVGIYSDAAPDTTIRRNLVVGTSNSKWWRSGTSVGPGIALNNEKYHYPSGGGSMNSSVQTKRAKVYGNLVANTRAGLTIWSGYEQSSYEDVLIYNNTFVDNESQLVLYGSPKPGSKFMNNILLSLSSGTHDVEGMDLNGMVAKNNYYSQGNPGGGYAHDGNRYTGLKIAKMSGWRAVSNVDQISWKDFVVASGSPVIGAGDEEPWRTSTNAQDYRLDYNSAEHKLPMDMGGLTFATPVGPRPLPPTVLSGT